MERIRRLLLTRTAAASAAVVWIGVILGCMSISIGGRHVTTGTVENGVFVQEGDFYLASSSARQVYYPVPYASSPNLEISETGLIDCHHEIVEQDACFFRVANNGKFGRTIKWTARGVRAVNPMPPPAPPMLHPPQPLPAEPIPVPAMDD